MGEANKTYIVSYKIIADAVGAKKELESLAAPVQQLKEQLDTVGKSCIAMKEAVMQTREALKSLNIRPEIDVTSFKSALASMEMNAARTAAKIRGMMESSLGGSRRQFQERVGQAGVGGWIDVKGVEDNALKERMHQSRLIKALRVQSTAHEAIKRALANEAKRAGGVVSSNLTYDDAVTKMIKKGGLRLSADQEKALRAGQMTVGGLNFGTRRVDGVMLQDIFKRDNVANGTRAKNIQNNERLLNWSRGWLNRHYPGGWGLAKDEANAVLKNMGSAARFGIDAQKGTVQSHWEDGDKFMGKLMSDVRAARQASTSAKTKMAALRKSAMASLASSPTGDFSGLVGPMNSADMDKMAGGIVSAVNAMKQIPKNPVTATVKMQMSGADAVMESLVAMLVKLQKKADSKPIKIQSTIVPPKSSELNRALKEMRGTKTKPGILSGTQIPITFSGVEELRSRLATIITGLQELAREKTITVRTRLAKPTKASTEELAALNNLSGGEKQMSVVANIAGNFELKLSLLKEFATLFKTLKNEGKNSSIKAEIRATGITSDAIKKIERYIKLFSGFKSENKTSTITARINAPSQSEFDKINKFKSGKGKGLKKSVMIDVAFSAKQAQSALSALKGLKLNAQIKPVWGGMKAKAEEMKNLESMIPPIKLRLDVSQAMGTLREFISKIREVSNQTIRLTTTAGRAINSAPKTSNTAIIASRGPNAPPSYMDRGGIGNSRWNKLVYPLTGRTSLGANTPAAISMAKGFGMMYAIGGAMSGISSALSQSIDYQNTMETARAILSKNYIGRRFDSDFREMEGIARQVGMDTRYTAPDVANATRFMAMAGMGIPTINKSLKPIANVATIGDNDLGEVADKITNIQAAFNLKGNQVRRLSDQMANTFTQTNTDMMMIAESMKYAAPMAHLAGAKPGETLAMIGVMGNAGIQSGIAGRTLRMMYQNVIKPSKSQKALWDEIGVKRVNDDGSFRNLIDILRDIATSKNVNDKNLASVVSGLFRVTASSGAAQVISDLRLGKNSLVNKIAYENNSYGINGLAESIAYKKQNTIKGLWDQVTSAFTEDNLKAFEGFHGVIREMLISIRDFLRSKEAVDMIRNVWSIVKDIMETLGWFLKQWINLFTGFTGKIAKGFVVVQFAMQQAGALLGAVSGVANVFIHLKQALFGVSQAAVVATGAVGGARSMAGIAGAVGTAGAVGMGSAVASNAALAAASSGGLVAANVPGYYWLRAKKPEGYGLSAKKQARTVLMNMGYAAPLAPVGLRDLRGEMYERQFAPGGISDTVSAKQQEIGKWERSRGYMTRGFTKTEKLQHNATINRHLASLRSDIEGLRSHTQMTGVSVNRASNTMLLANAALWSRNMGFGGVPYTFNEKIPSNHYIGYTAPVSQVMPFNKYSGRTSAVLFGGSALAGNYASYRNRAAMWNTLALSRVYDPETKTYGFKYSEAERARMLGKGGMYMRAADNAYHLQREADKAARMAKLREAVAQRRASRMTDLALMQRYTSMKRVNWSYMGTSIATAFAMGRTSNTFGSIMATLRGGLFSVVTGISKCLGMLISPVGLTIGALAALSFGIYKFVDTIKEHNKALEKAKEAMKKPSLDSKNAKAYNEKWSNFEYTDYSAPHGGSLRFKSLMEREKYQAIFDPNMSSLDIIDLYYGGDRSLMRKNTATNLKMAVARKALSDIGAESSSANHRYIAKLIEDARGKGPKGMEEARKKALEYAEKFNPARRKGLKTTEGMTLEQIGRINDIRNYREYQEGLYRSLVKDAMGESAWTRRIAAVQKLSGGVKAYTSEWFNAVNVILENCEARIGDIKFKFQVKNGKIDMEKTLAAIRATKKHFLDTLKEWSKTYANLYAELLNNGVVGDNSYRAWIDFVRGMNKRHPVTEADVKAHYARNKSALTAKGYTEAEYVDLVMNGKSDLAANERKSVRRQQSTVQAIESKRNFDKAQAKLRGEKTAYDNFAAGEGTGGNGASGNDGGGSAGGGGNGGDGKNLSQSDGYKNNYDRQAGRPTQIILNIDKLANFDKSEFFTADQQRTAMMVQDMVGQGLMNLIPQINAALAGLNGA